MNAVLQRSLICLMCMHGKRALVKATDCQGVEQQQLEMLLKAWALQQLSGMRLPKRMVLRAAAHQMGASGTATRWPASAPTWAKSDFSSAEKGLTTMQSTH